MQDVFALQCVLFQVITELSSAQKNAPSNNFQNVKTYSIKTPKSKYIYRSLLDISLLNVKKL